MLHLDTSFDNEFSSLSKLNWLPWIGKNYKKNRVLIIGESHYDDNEGWLNDRNATRHFVNNQGLHSDNPDFRNRSLFQQIEKTLLNKDTSSFEERHKIWKNVGFFNLVQELLPSRQDRPSEENFDDEWENFIQLLDILKSKVCIKYGYEGNGRLGSLLNVNNKGWERDNTEEFFIKPYCFNLTKADLKVKIILTHHPTGAYGFDYRIWNEHIKNHFLDISVLFD